MKHNVETMMRVVSRSLRGESIHEIAKSEKVSVKQIQQWESIVDEERPDLSNLHAHDWKIEDPNGSWGVGVCKRCFSIKLFPNFGADWKMSPNAKGKAKLEEKIKNHVGFRVKRGYKRSKERSKR